MIHIVRAEIAQIAFSNARDVEAFKSFQVDELSRCFARDVVSRYLHEIKTSVNDKNLSIINELSLYVYTKEELEEYVKWRIEEDGLKKNCPRP